MSRLWSRLLPRPGSRLDSAPVRPQALASHGSRIRTHVQAFDLTPDLGLRLRLNSGPGIARVSDFVSGILPAPWARVPVPAPSPFRPRLQPLLGLGSDFGLPGQEGGVGRRSQGPGVGSPWPAPSAPRCRVRQLSTAAQLVLLPPLRRLRAPGSSPRLARPCPGHGVEVTARSEEQRLPARSLGEA